MATVEEVGRVPGIARDRDIEPGKRREDRVGPLPPVAHQIGNAPGPGLYTEWTKCQDSTKGYSGCKFSGFTTLEEAVTYLNMNSISHSDLHVYHWPADVDSNVCKVYTLQEFCGFIKCDVPPEITPETDVDVSTVAPVVYVDGACSDNGQIEAQGGDGSSGHCAA